MAEKGFGVKDINLIGPSGTPTITSPNNLNLNANNVAISTNVSIGGTLSVTGNISVGGTLTYEDVTNIDSVGLITAREGIKIPDNKYAYFGSDNDLEITHSGSNGNINNKTGDLVIRTLGSGDDIFIDAVDDVNIRVQSTDNAITCIGDGAVTLHYNGNSKLATTNTGVDVTGALTVNGSAISIDPTNSDVQVAYTVTANGTSAYRFAGNGVVSTADNPDLYLIRGQKYRFINNSGGSHPFQIREASGGTAYSTGVTNNGASSGNIDFAPTFDSPAQLVYQCTSHGGMVGNIYLRDAAGNNTNVGVVTATAFIPTQGQLSHRNIIVNGDMTVSQRGTTFSQVDNNEITLDRFGLIHPYSTHFDVSQSTTAPDGFSKSYKLDVNVTDTSIGVGQFAAIRYRVEAQDLQQLAYGTSSAKPITVSFYVRSNQTGNFGFNIQQADNSDKQVSQTYTINSSDTWERKSFTFAGDTSGQINDDNGIGFNIIWWLAAGSSYASGTARSTWTNYAQADSAVGHNVNILGSTSNNFYITGVQLEVGSVATPFEHRSRVENLARCQRYCVLKGGANGTYDAMATGAVWNSTVAFVPYFLPVEMRDTPSLTLVGSLSDFRYTRSGSEVTPSGLTFDQGGKSMCAVRLTGSSMTQNDAVRLYNMNTNGGFLFTAEL